MPGRHFRDILQIPKITTTNGGVLKDLEQTSKENEAKKLKRKRRKRKEKFKEALKEIGEALLIAVVLALIIRTFVFQAFKIPSSSMENTLLVGDHILVSKFAYGLQVPKASIIGWTDLFDVIPLPILDGELKRLWGEIKRGDVIVFRFPEDRTKDFIKRAVALEGDEVEVRGRELYINDVLHDESEYAIFKGGSGGEVERTRNFGPFIVPAGTVFVMGDNRDRSYDSRFWGVVPVKEIKGKAFVIYWSREPSDPWPSGMKLERFGEVIK